jgi:hypothetical protein
LAWLVAKKRKNPNEFGENTGEGERVGLNPPPFFNSSIGKNSAHKTYLTVHHLILVTFEKNKIALICFECYYYVVTFGLSGSVRRSPPLGQRGLVFTSAK